MSDSARFNISGSRAPYTNAEIESLGDTFPDRGEYCPRCETYIPAFATLSMADVEVLREFRPFQAIKAVREKTGCSLVWAKIWALHPNGPHSLDPSKPCPYCDLPLHMNANQCLLCRMNWHDPDNPVRLGQSIADQILSAPAGSTISVVGRNALGSALTFVQLKRPNDNLTLKLIPLANYPDSSN